jgi:hypothetical protein
MAIRLAAAVALIAVSAPLALAIGQCPTVPLVPGVDQTPSHPAFYGKCTGALEKWVNASSHWCKFNDLGMWPNGPNDKAKKCMKFGRATIYRGPIYGSSPQHKAACNKWLTGDDSAAMVAVSTKYLKTYHGGWSTDKGACDKCMCVRLHGADDKYNRGLQREPASKHVGLTFLAKVGGWSALHARPVYRGQASKGGEQCCKRMGSGAVQLALGATGCC